NLPAAQPRRQPGVLPLLADSQRQLVIRYHGAGGLLLVVQEHLHDLGRAQRVGHEAGRVRRPLDDVDLLAPQLLHHGLHARPARTDARAHRVYVGVVRVHRDLGAAPGLAGHRLNLHDAVVNFRDLQLEQPLQPARMRAGDVDDGSARRLADLGDVHFQAGARRVRFARDLLAGNELGFDAAQVDDDVALVHALHDAGDDVALAVGVLLVQQVALRVADALDDDLFGRPRRDTTEVPRRHFHLNYVADLVVGVDAARFFERNFG